MSDFGSDSDYSDSEELSDSVESEEESFSDDSDAIKEAEDKKAKAQEEAEAIRKKVKKEVKKLSYEELEARKKARLKELRKAAKESSDDDSDEPREGAPTADRFTEDNTHLFGSAKEAKIIPKMVSYFGPCEVKDFPLKTREDFVNLAEELGEKMSTSRPEFVEDFLLELIVPLLKKLDTVHTNQIYKICEVAYNLKCRAEIEANKRKKKKKYSDRAQTKVKSYDPNFREDDSDDGDFDAFM